MLTVEPRSLLRKLNTTCTRALEAAAGACLSNRHYEVTVEHLLLALLDDSGSDARAALSELNVDLDTARTAVQRSIADLRTGNAGKPVFSTLLLEWVQEAWLFGSIELGQWQLRSIALLVRLVLTPLRYTGAPWPWLESFDREQLKRDALLIASRSNEAMTDAAAAPEGTGAPAGRSDQSALGRFTSDLTDRARRGELDPVFGREREIRQMIEILIRRRKNNPIIIGEAGVGKTALAEGLALRIVENKVPAELANARLVSLDLGQLQAGAGVKGEFENRLKAVLNEVKASPTPILLFIDEAHALIGAGGSQGTGDAANLLKPALARGELRTIAATTYAEFKKHIEKDTALERRFQPVRVEEPSPELATVMLRGLAAEFQRVYGVTIQDSAVVAAVDLSARYISGRQLPDKAVDLLDTSAAFVKLVRAAPPPELEDTEAKLQALDREIAAIDADTRAGLEPNVEARNRASEKREELLTRVAELKTRLDDQRAIVAKLDDARRRAREQTEESVEAELTASLDAWNKVARDDRLVAADVDESVIERIVADWTGIPIGNMVRNTLDTILALEERLRGRVLGQDRALEAIARELRAAQAGLKNPSTPHGVFLLVGPSGVGKTETALALAEALFGGERFVVTINMSEFQERHTVSRLIGSPPGYVGYGEGGVLTEAVRHRPYSLVLLDEVEKADKEVLNIFYQVFDKGMLADGEGRIIDFKNTVVVMTSNLATDLITQAAPPGSTLQSLDTLVELVKPTLSAHFKPALLARMSVVPYVPIGPEALETIVRMKVQAVVDRARRAHDIDLVVDDAIVPAIAERCREVESGARNVEHVLRRSVLPVLSRSILEALLADTEVKELKLRIKGSEFVVDWSQPGEQSKQEELVATVSQSSEQPTREQPVAVALPSSEDPAGSESDEEPTRSRE
jgi:type VI secretion system protein VasG